MRTNTELFEKLGARVSEELGEWPDDARVSQRRALVAMVSAPDVRRANNKKQMVFGIAGVLAAACVLFALATTFWPAASTDIAILPFKIGVNEVVGTEGSWVQSAKDAVDIQFDDGSAMKLSKATSVRVVESNVAKVNVDLSDGSLKADIKKNGKTKWLVHAGPYKVEVLGTSFDVNWNASSSELIVSVRKGLVLVKGGEIEEHGIKIAKGKRLFAGGVLERVAVESISFDNTPIGLAKRNLDTADSVATVEKSANLAAAPEKTKNNINKSGNKKFTKKVTWKELAAKGKYKASVKAAKDAGLENLLLTLNVKDLWTLANTARYAQAGDVSKQAFLAVRQRFVGTRKARTAAFMLGRLEFDLRKNPSAASVWFTNYLKEDPSGALAEEALGRLIDACNKSGQKNDAKRNAQLYLSRYQDGLFAKLAKSILESN